MSLFTGYTDGGDSSRKDRINILATSRLDLVSDLIVLRHSDAGLVVRCPDRASTSTAALTAAQVLSGHITYTGAAGALTLPTAATVVAAISGCEVGDRFSFAILNSSSDNGDCSITAGVGNSVTSTLNNADGNISDDTQAILLAVVENVTSSSEAVNYFLLNNTA